MCVNVPSCPSPHDFNKIRTITAMSSCFSQGGDDMKVQQIREIARSKGLQPGKAEKAELIKTIQRQEGNFDCFSAAQARICDQIGCLGGEDFIAGAGGGS